MSEAEHKPARSSIRDFLNRREPGARWALLLLAVVAILALCCIGYSWFNHQRSVAPLILILVILAWNRNERWSLPMAPVFPDTRWAVPPSARRWVWLMAAAASILAIWPRSSQLNSSLSAAEIDRLPSYITTASSRDSLLFQNSWRESLSGFQPGMHGPWCNLESQLGWILIGGKIEGQPTAKVRALRTFPWLSGLLSIGLITLLSAAMGIPRAGLAAGLIMAMHPLHIHWSLEVGGLSTMLMSLTVAMLCMLQVFRTNRWRWWAGLAAAQTVCMLCHGSAAFGLVALDVAAIIVFMKSGATKSAVWSHNRRLFVAAMLTLLAFVTVIPTESQWSWGIKKSFWPGLLSGVSGTGSGTGLDSLIQEPVWRSWMVWGILPLCSLAGLVALLIQDWRTRFVGGSLAGASLLAWFIGGPAAALPFALLLLPLSLAWSGTWLMRLFPAVPRMAHAPVAAAVLFVMTTAPALQRTLAVPNSPLKDVVATAGGRDEQQPGTITAFFGYYHATARFADPGVVFIDRLATLRKLVDDAFDHGQPLYVYHSLNQNTLIDWPHTVKELQTSGRFLLVREFPAFDPRQNIRLYKYQPREQIIRLNVKPEKKPEP